MSSSFNRRPLRKPTLTNSQLPKTSWMTLRPFPGVSACIPCASVCSPSYVQLVGSASRGMPAVSTSSSCLCCLGFSSPLSSSVSSTIWSSAIGTKAGRGTFAFSGTATRTLPLPLPSPSESACDHTGV